MSACLSGTFDDVFLILGAPKQKNFLRQNRSLRKRFSIYRPLPPLSAVILLSFEMPKYALLCI